MGVEAHRFLILRKGQQRREALGKESQAPPLLRQRKPYLTGSPPSRQVRRCRQKLSNEGSITRRWLCANRAMRWHAPHRESAHVIYVFMPTLRRMLIIGHQLEKADWNRFNPTKAVSRNQYGLTQYPKATDATTKAPAISRRYRSMFIYPPLQSAACARSAGAGRAPSASPRSLR